VLNLARKSKIVTITNDGRDKGKKYQIMEMSALKAEKWAARAFLALAHAGVEVPDEVKGAGMAALAVVGLRALGNVSWGEAEPLLDEMMECVQFMPDTKHPGLVRELYNDDIEEVVTLALLRSEVFELHTGFSLAGAVNNSIASEDSDNKIESNTISTFRRNVG